jgi:hypothetical protein
MTWSGDPNWPPGSLPEVLNLSDLTAINDALSVLFANLRFAKRLYQDPQSSDRLATLVSLDAAWQFLFWFDPVLKEGLHLPLSNLVSALIALNDNNVAPILSPTPKPTGGRSPDSPDRLGLIGIAVGTVDRLLWTKMPSGEARRLVAAELVKLGIKPARGTRRIGARTIKEWCDRLSADRVAVKPILASQPGAIANADPNDIARFVAVINADEMTTAKWRSILDRLPEPVARKFILDSLRTSIRARLVGANRPSATESANPPS